MEEFPMAKKEIDWSNIGFGYIKTDYRYVSNFNRGRPHRNLPPGLKR